MALLSPRCLDMVVVLATPKVAAHDSYQYKATGFIYGHQTDESGKSILLYLVTNRHVFEGMDELTVRFNRTAGSDPKCYDLPLKKSDGSTLWTAHRDSNCDVAVVPIRAQLLIDDGIDYKWFDGRSQEQVLSIEKARSIQISEGDGVFVLGFPLGVVGKERNYTIVRQGTIARIQDWLEGNSREILIDALVFPGNSGGPVFIKPELAGIEGTKANKTSYLLGMVSKYLLYEDIAVSPQTGLPRVVFQENSGLAVVVPIDVIQETILEAMKNQTLESIGKLK